MTPEEKYGTYGPGCLEGFSLEHNVRELGGYEVAGGRHVKRGVFVRCAALADLDADEVGLLGKLDLRSILDLRSRVESDATPDPIPAGVLFERVCAMRDENGDELDFSPEAIGLPLEDVMKLMSGGVPEDASPEERERLEGVLRRMNDEMAGYYTAMAFDNPAYRLMFDWIEKGEVPLLFHCTAGKDRTGVGAMLILLALGVSEGDALFDYDLTNVYRASCVKASLERAKDLIARSPELKTMVTMADGVDLALGQAVLRGVLERYGSYEAYFEAEYGLDQGRLEALRDRYTE